jgi:hypothetical protein
MVRKRIGAFGERNTALQHGHSRPAAGRSADTEPIEREIQVPVPIAAIIVPDDPD